MAKISPVSEAQNKNNVEKITVGSPAKPASKSSGSAIYDTAIDEEFQRTKEAVQLMKGSE